MLPKLYEWIEADRLAVGLPWPEYLKGNCREFAVRGLGWRYENFARTSSITATGMRSRRRAWRAARSMGRGWSQRMMPVVCPPAFIRGTAKPAFRAKVPPEVMRTTIGTWVTVLKRSGETTRTGLLPCC